MREANWDEIFQRRHEDDDVADTRLNAVVPWEEWLTFGIVAMLFMAVVGSIDSARWVDNMPSLYPVGFAGLVAGYLLARAARPAALLLPTGALAGATLIYLQLLAVLPGASPVARTDNMLDRMHRWWFAVTHNGISTDGLPVIILVLVILWLGAFLSAWAVFRWRNAWLALLPGGTVLMWNISFLRGQASLPLIVFLFGAVLLLMRLHVAQREREWEREGVYYPEFISLSALHATFWVAIGLLVLVWLMPLADRSETAHERWEDFTAPLTRHLKPLARVFVGVNSKRAIAIHNLKDALPFQGKIELTGREAVEVDVELSPEVARFLRAQSFDEYTRDGWKVNVEGAVPLAPNQDAPSAAANDAAASTGARREVTVHVKVQGGNDELLFSLGQPQAADRPATADAGADPQDITRFQPAGNLSDGDEYTVTGSVTTASIEQLRAAGDGYPQWVRERYLDLPRNLPRRVRGKAVELTQAADNPYDRATAIEKYLRTFPVDYNVPKTPDGRDSVDYFLFDLKRGYFDYHASAMAVMLRSLGIPARVATGYALDPLARQGDTTRYDLTERNAFAWPEVYFPGIGWVEFSPTPSQPPIVRPGTPTGGTTNEQADPNIRPDEPALDLGTLSATPLAGRPASSAGGGGRDWTLPLVGAGLLAVVLALAAAAQLWWDRGLRGLPYTAQLWEKTQRLARLGRLPARESETPREFAARLRRDVPGAAAAGYLAARYERSRYGHHEPPAEERERLDTAWASLRTALLRRALRLKPRADG